MKILFRLNMTNDLQRWWFPPQIRKACWRACRCSNPWHKPPCQRPRQSQQLVEYKMMAQLFWVGGINNDHLKNIFVFTCGPLWGVKSTREKQREEGGDILQGVLTNHYIYFLIYMIWSFIKFVSSSQIQKSAPDVLSGSSWTGAASRCTSLGRARQEPSSDLQLWLPKIQFVLDLFCLKTNGG